MSSAASDQLPFEIVVIAVSAGGLEALTELLSSLPADFPAPIVIVQHLGRNSPSFLAAILNRRASLPVQDAVQGKALRGGVVYLAPSDCHLRITPQKTVALSHEARVQFSRPAADLLFESVAAVFGRRALAVVLTGRGEDGAAGTQAIKQAGGTTIAQDPHSSSHASMPEAAIRTDCVDLVLSLPAIAPALVTLVMAPAAP